MTPLFKKLNFKNHKAILVLNAPTSFVSEKEAMANETVFYNNENEIITIDFVMVFFHAIARNRKSNYITFSKN